jgi:hypothetical protein
VTNRIDQLAALSTEERRRVFAALNQDQRAALLRELKNYLKNPWSEYLGDPVGFVERGLGETTWSLQREVLRSVVENKRTSVPATHAPGKTHLAARVAAYWIAVHPPGTARVITTATTFRQVKGLLWPHIRRLQSAYNLIGQTAATTWTYDGDFLAEGVKPPDDAEAGISGYHAPHLLIIIDEAGGIKHAFGQSIEALMTGVDTHMLVLGNPPVSGEVTWFEKVSNSPLFNTIVIPYDKTPNFTGEDTGPCRSCPPEVEAHQIGQHLIDQQWIDEQLSEFGEHSTWFQARALARFVHDSSAKTLPIDWLELARVVTEAGPGPIKLGVDVAADGGDEFVIAKMDGWTITLEHASRGQENHSAPAVAAVILDHIRKALTAHRERGIDTPVRVKVDTIGVGWGVVGILQQWEGEGLLQDGPYTAHIVPVNVANKARKDKKFYNQRAEMWWNMRALIEPNNPAAGLLRLDLGTKEIAQLNAPTYAADSTARITIEKKAEMKKRGVHSPDRAEAILLAAYEPPEDQTDLPIAVPLAVPQANTWG